MSETAIDRAVVDTVQADEPLKVLVVDDVQTNRLILKAMLKKEGFVVAMAENGQEAVDLFSRVQPDIVLMDIVMPVMDGYEAARQIKQLSGERFVPIIFLTAKNDDESLAKCIECGGDDFLGKPYNKVILQAKLNALVRMKELYGNLRAHRDQLAGYQEQLKKEQEVAESVFANIVHPGCLDSSIIQHLVSPMAVFNGDLLLAAPKPSGGLHVLLGDFTGHGLSAAIGAMPVADLFYTLTANGFSIVDIVKDVNAKLKGVLPTGIFFAATLMDFEFSESKLSVWNSGNPDVLVYSGGEIARRLKSKHLPLGIVDNRALKTELDILELKRGDRVYAFSDGLTEARGIESEMFGQERVEAVFERNERPEDAFQDILETLAEFRSGEGQCDDITLIEVTNLKSGLQGAVAHTPESHASKPATAWRVSMNLSSECLRLLNPVPLLTQLLMEVQGLYPYREELFTILAELYNNSLDHGILELKSELKQTPEGFSEYYAQRESRLKQIENQFIRVTLAHWPKERGGKLIIQVEDTGPGFDVEASRPDLAANKGNSGRGIPLVRSLCREVAYKGKGNLVRAVYEWE